MRTSSISKPGSSAPWNGNGRRCPEASMYIPKYSAESRPDVLAALMRRYGFATLVSSGPAGLLATHLPVVLKPSRDGGPASSGRLQMHVARPNAHWREFDGTPGPSPEAMVIFAGPHTYISPSWYVEPKNVPTWNYIAVHAYGS